MQKNTKSGLLQIAGLVLIALASVTIMAGCGAGMQSAIYNNTKYGTMNVTTDMAEPIFLGDIPPERKVVCIITNATDKDINLSLAVALLESRGVRYSLNCGPGVYKIQHMVTYAGQAEENIIDQWMRAAYGAPWAMTGTTANIGMGATVGALATRSLAGGVGGAIIGLGMQALDTYIGAKNEKGVCIIASQIEVTEPVSNVSAVQSTTSHLRQGTSTVSTQQFTTKEPPKYRTNAVTKAIKVGLKFEEAKQELEKSLARAIAGMFPTPLVPMQKAQMQ